MVQDDHSYPDIGDQIFHPLHNFSDGQVLQHILTHTDDFPDLRLIKGQQQRGGPLEDAYKTNTTIIVTYTDYTDTGNPLDLNGLV